MIRKQVAKNGLCEKFEEFCQKCGKIAVGILLLILLFDKVLAITLPLIEDIYLKLNIIFSLIGF